MSGYTEREQLRMMAERMRVLHGYLLKITINSGQPVDELDKELEELNDMPIVGNRREKYQESFQLLWTQFRPGIKSLSDVVSEFEQLKMQKLRNNEPFTLVDPFIMDKGAYYRIDPLTMKVDKDPIITPEEVTLKMFEHDIWKCPLTGRFNLSKTLKSILKSAQKIGCTRDHVGFVLQRLINQEMPEHYGAVQYLDDSLKIYNHCVALIDFNDDKMEIVSAMKKIVREPGDGIFKSALTFHSLMCELISMETGQGISDDDVIDKADYETGRALKNLVQSETWNLFQATLAQRFAMFGKPCSFKDKLKIIADIEQTRRLHLDFPRKMENVDFSIYNVAVNHNSQTYIRNIPSYQAKGGRDFDDDDDDDDDYTDGAHATDYPSASSSRYRSRHQPHESTRTHALSACRLCGLNQDTDHTNPSVCPYYGQIKSSDKKCQICWNKHKIVAFHFHSVCLNA